MKEYLFALPIFPNAKGIFNHPTILVRAKNFNDAINLVRHLKPNANIGEHKVYPIEE
jgi:hypothetical protein